MYAYKLHTRVYEYVVQNMYFFISALESKTIMIRNHIVWYCCKNYFYDYYSYIASVIYLSFEIIR